MSETEVQPKKPREKRETIKRLRLTEAEAEKWEASAADAEMNLSDWIRSKVGNAKETHIQKAKKPVNVITADPAMIRELAKIGNNLNQIARSLNQCSKNGSLVQVIEVTLVLKSIERDLSHVLPKLPESPSLTRKTPVKTNKAKLEG